MSSEHSYNAVKPAVKQDKAKPAAVAATQQKKTLGWELRTGCTECVIRPISGVPVVDMTKDMQEMMSSFLVFQSSCKSFLVAVPGSLR